MHTSPLYRQGEELVNPRPMRVQFEGRYSAKVLALAVAWFCLTALCFSPFSRAAEISQIADKRQFQDVLKGPVVSRAVQSLYFFHFEWAFAHEESVFPTLLAASLAVGPATQEKQPDAATEAPPADQQASPTTPTLDLSDEVVRDVLTKLQSGIETHDLERVLEIFDQQNMKDFAQFHDNMVAFFRRYDSVKFRYQLLQVTSDKELGFAIADIDMDADPSDILPTPQRRSTQMRFQLKRGPKGWKVVAMRPADFFNL